MRGTDFAFANDVRAAAELRTPQTSQMILFSTLALLVTAGSIGGVIGGVAGGASRAGAAPGPFGMDITDIIRRPQGHHGEA